MTAPQVFFAMLFVIGVLGMAATAAYALIERRAYLRGRREGYGDGLEAGGARAEMELPAGVVYNGRQQVPNKPDLLLFTETIVSGSTFTLLESDASFENILAAALIQRSKFTARNPEAFA